MFSISFLFGSAVFGIAYGAGNSITYEKAEPSDTHGEKPASDSTEPIETEETQVVEAEEESLDTNNEETDSSADEETAPEPKTAAASKTSHDVPFYSQFTDISAPEWRKIGCGIASLAMLIDFYKPGEISVDTLLDEGISANAYVGDAGWSHAGLIGLAQDHGLSGEAVYMNELSMAAAFSKLEAALKEGPVMVSVHYTFKPTNPIPHLVIATGVENGEVRYNDPAEKTGDGSVSIEQFQSAWKKRYIAIRE